MSQTKEANNPITLAVDLGGTRIKLGLLEGCTLLASAVFDAQSRTGLAPQLDRVRDGLRRICNEQSIAPDNIAGIGMGVPALLNQKRNRILSTIDKYPDGKELDLGVWARENFGAPLTLDNDVNLALLGEWVSAGDDAADNAVIMTIGTGIGTAAMVDGELFRGGHGQAGCLGGHMTVAVDGHECVCGNRGCLESEASSWALPRLVDEHPGHGQSVLAHLQPVTFKDVFQAVEQGDRVAQDCLDHCLRCWGAGAVNLIHAYDPDCVILGGGVLAQADSIVPFVENYVKKHAWTAWGSPRIQVATQPDYAALIGAAHAVINKEVL